MIKNIICILTAAMLTLSAGSALAAFADLQLIRVYYDPAGVEIGTDLGTVATILTSATPTTVNGSFSDVNGSATLLGAYFSLDRTTNRLWVSGIDVTAPAATFAPAIIGNATGLTSIKNGTTPMYTLFNNQGGTNYSGLASAPSSYKIKISSVAGFFANTITAANNARTFSELTLATLATNNTQTLWYWPNGLATTAGGKTGVAVAQIVTNANGSTTITPITTRVDGVCGATSGQSILSKPASNLCTTGAPSEVTGIGPWKWGCSGKGIDGTGVAVSADCSSGLIYYITRSIVPDPITGETGTLNCVSPVAPGGSSVCTITPGAGAVLASLTDDGNNVTASVSANSYTITNVQANHTVEATFAAGASTTTPTITWGPLAAISYGTVLSATQLGAVASDPGTAAPVAGTFTYTTSLGAVLTINDVLAAGSYQLTATFTPTDTATYGTATATATLAVNQAVLNVTATTLAKFYGTVDPALTYAVAGFVNGETSAVMSGGLTRAPGENVGSYAISQGTVAATANYIISYTGANLTINPATLNVTAAAQGKTYGAVDPALTYTASGFANGDTNSIMTGSLARAAGENVGSYSITQGTVAATTNYTISYTGASLVISPATLTVAANSLGKMFNTINPALTFTISGYVNGESAAILTGTPTLGTTAITNSPVGVYPISITAGTLAAPNYIFSPTSGLLTVTPVSLAVNPVYIPGNRSFATMVAAVQGIIGDCSILLSSTYPAALQPEALLFNNGFTVSLKGGMDTSGNPTAGISTIFGNITIKSGRLNVSGLAIR